MPKKGCSEKNRAQLTESWLIESRLLILRLKRQTSGEDLCHWNENRWAMVGEGFTTQVGEHCTKWEEEASIFTFLTKEMSSY